MHIRCKQDDGNQTVSFELPDDLHQAGKVLVRWRHVRGMSHTCRAYSLQDANVMFVAAIERYWQETLLVDWTREVLRGVSDES